MTKSVLVLTALMSLSQVGLAQNQSAQSQTTQAAFVRISDGRMVEVALVAKAAVQRIRDEIPKMNQEDQLRYLLLDKVTIGSPKVKREPSEKLSYAEEILNGRPRLTPEITVPIVATGFELEITCIEAGAVSSAGAGREEAVLQGNRRVIAAQKGQAAFDCSWPYLKTGIMNESEARGWKGAYAANTRRLTRIDPKTRKSVLPQAGLLPVDVPVVPQAR